MTLDIRSVDRRLLVGSELWLCIAQLNRPKGNLGPENRNQSAAEAITALLHSDATGRAPIDRDCENDALTRILLLPELAFGIDDLEMVDNAIRSYDKAIVVIAGAGFAKASSLRASVDFLDNVSDDRNVNFGCVWIHFPERHGGPASHERHFYCKNFHEQRGEVPGFDPVLGSHHVVIKFEDCSVAPLICSDLLADSQQGRQNASDQLRAYRIERDHPVIVAASVLQDQPWNNVWSSRIDRIVDGNLLLILANFAHAGRPECYLDDLNRNLSGAYVNAGQISTPLPETAACISKTNATVKGTVLRDCCEVFVAGMLRVDNFSATTGRHLWLVRWGQNYKEGAFAPINTRLNYEIPRLVNRTRHLSPSNAARVVEVTTHLDQASEDRKKRFFLSIAYGPDAKDADPDPVRNTTANAATELALCAVDALVRSPYFGWPDDDRPSIELRIPAGADIGGFSSHGYVWRSASQTWSAMAEQLQAYAQNPHPRPALIVFAEDINGTDLQHDDIAQRDAAAPEAHDLDPATPRSASNIVIAVPLSKVKRLSGEVANAGSFGPVADSIFDSIIDLAGLRIP